MKQLKIYFTSDVHGYIYPTDYTDNTLKPLGFLNIINQLKKMRIHLLLMEGIRLKALLLQLLLARKTFTLIQLQRFLMQEAMTT